MRQSGRGGENYFKLNQQQLLQRENQLQKQLEPNYSPLTTGHSPNGKKVKVIAHDGNFAFLQLLKREKKLIRFLKSLKGLVIPALQYSYVCENVEEIFESTLLRKINKITPEFGW